MNIAIIGLITRPISPDTHGGTEAVTYTLVESLIKQGHQVTLYASSDSQTSAECVSVCDSTTAHIVSMNANLAQPYSLLLARLLAERAHEYDVIHNNFFHTYIMSAFAPFIKTPLVHTVHNSYFSNADWTKVLHAYPVLPHERYIFVSEHARIQAGSFPGSVVIRNGINTDIFTYSPTPENYMLWVGRMVPEKGAIDAIMTVKGGSTPLKLLTVCNDTEHNEYLDVVVKPQVTSPITLQIGHTREEKVKLYGHAKAVFFPIHWEEPFGLVMAEAMACGTPVIAYARGATPEVIQDGITGYLVNASKNDIRGSFITKKTGVEGLREAMQRLYSLPADEYARMRAACRKDAENRFTIPRMIDEYESLYSSIIRK